MLRGALSVPDFYACLKVFVPELPELRAFALDIG